MWEMTATAGHNHLLFFQLKVQQMEYGMPDLSFRDDLTVRLTRAQFLYPSTLSVCGLV
jgi:hypothetical protein